MNPSVQEHASSYGFRRTRADLDWTAERRERFLLRSDVAVPKSVDGNVWEVWPSPGRQAGEDADFLECDLASLRTSISGQARPDDVVDVCFSVFTETEDFDQEYAPPRVWDAGPVWKDCVRLGYDVADFGGRSLLSNCAPSPAEMARVREAFLGYINDHGLFADLGAAERFRAVSEHPGGTKWRVYVYGVYLLQPLG